jgi:predicted ATP-grasp superfamily ATP-dependent carboligase
MKVLVTDGAERASLAVTRSLSRRGIDVTVGESYGHCTAFFSKYCQNHIVYPSPDDNSDRFIEGLLSILRTGKYEVIYPIREITSILVSRFKSELEKYVKVPLPEYAKMLIVHDKEKTLKFAREAGISCPRVYDVNNFNEVRELSNRINYPVVIKPRFKVDWKNGKPVMLKVTPRNYIHDSGMLLSRYREISEMSTSPPLIQEYIPGKGYGVECLCNNGDPRALFMHRRLREYPITGGASTLREGIYDERLKELALALLARLKWHGVAMVEFKIDDRDNTPKLMEINGRFWGSLALSIFSGVDFPYLLHRLITEGDVPSVLSYQTGVKCRWLLPGDILWFLSSLKNRRDKIRVAREFSQFRGIRDDIISTDDPLPVVGAIRCMLHQLIDVLKKKRNFDGEIKLA